jgi:hypothetical protein
MIGGLANRLTTEVPLSNAARYWARQRIRSNVAFFYCQAVAQKQVLNGLGRNEKLLLAQPAAQFRMGQSRMFDLFRQNGNAFEI